MSSVRSRFKVKVGGKPLVLRSDHPAVIEDRPLFPSRVFNARKLGRILISGENNRKLGSHWSKGWPGLPIFTLSLPERSTCPDSCPVRDACMGNRQQHTYRVANDNDLIPKLGEELFDLASMFPTGFSVRLHALGDFPDLAYARFWVDQVRHWKPLHVFGFTAHRRTSEIGAILERESARWDRFRLRFSAETGERSSSVITEPSDPSKPRLRGKQAGGIICPVESSDAPNCGSCGLCLNSRRPIVFKLH